jgi:hypothetical protein
MFFNDVLLKTIGLLHVNEKQWIFLQNPNVAFILWAHRASARSPGGPVRACWFNIKFFIIDVSHNNILF